MGPRSLPVFVKAGWHPGLCSPRSCSSPFLWPWHCLVAGPAGQPGLLLSLGGKFCCVKPLAASRRHWEARKCWLVGLHSGLKALLTLGTAQHSPFPCTVVNRQRHEGRRKLLLMRVLTQWMLHLAAASVRNHPSPGKNPLFIRITES